MNAEHTPHAADVEPGESAFAGLANMLATVCAIQAAATPADRPRPIRATDTRLVVTVRPDHRVDDEPNEEEISEQHGELQNSRMVMSLQRSCGLAEGSARPTLADLADLADAIEADAFAARQARRKKRHPST